MNTGLEGKRGESRAAVDGPTAPQTKATPTESVGPQHRKITVYLDESGTHRGSEAVAVAGYVATDDAWNDFNGEWREALDEFGLEYFRMSRFSSRTGRYVGWTEGMRHERLRRLIDITNRHALASVGSVIPLEAYDRIFIGPARDRSGGPYGLAGIACAIEVGQWLRQESDSAAMFVFESGALGSSQLQKFVDDVRGDAKHTGILSVSFAGKREFTPLQAADILAYEIQRLPGGDPGKDGQRARSDWVDRLAQIPRSWTIFDVHRLQDFAQFMTRGQRDFGSSTWPAESGLRIGGPISLV